MEDELRLSRQPLIEPAQLVTEYPACRVGRHESRSDLVGYRYDHSGGVPPGADQVIDLGMDDVCRVRVSHVCSVAVRPETSGVHDTGQPGADSVDEQHAVG